MLLSEVKSIFHKELEGLYPKEEVDSFFGMFLEYYLKLERFVLVLHPGYTITKQEGSSFFEGLTRLKKEEPIQYILEEAHFMDLKFKVNPNVLIPRPETEELVRWILEGGEMWRGKDLSILDIGTGSGCIAISLAKNLPNVTVYAFDISKDAIEVAKENAKTHKVSIEFFEQDVFNFESELKFDCIVSNPPYVREMEKVTMGKNVKAYEPELALFVLDSNPLKFYKTITAFSVKHLKPNGRVYFEINQYLAENTQQVLFDHHFNDVELKKDIFGNFRMLKGKINAK